MITIELRVDSRNDGEHTIVTVAGEIDLATTPTLRTAIDELLDQNQTQIAVDFSEVGFLDSTGLGMLVSMQRRASEAGGSLSLTSVTRPVRRVLQITGLEELFGLDASTPDEVAT